MHKNARCAWLKPAGRPAPVDKCSCGFQTLISPNGSGRSFLLALTHRGLMIGDRRRTAIDRLRGASSTTAYHLDAYHASAADRRYQPGRTTMVFTASLPPDRRRSPYCRQKHSDALPAVSLVTSIRSGARAAMLTNCTLFIPSTRINQSGSIRLAHRTTDEQRFITDLAADYFGCITRPTAISAHQKARDRRRAAPRRDDLPNCTPATEPHTYLPGRQKRRR